MKRSRSRIRYAILIALVIGAGLASRSSFAEHLPRFVAEYAGDTLWALTLFLTLGWWFSAARTSTVGLAALAIAFSVEFSQLYQAPWIVRLRETLPGRLLLGSGFLWSDLLCYTVGVATGWAGERWGLGKKGEQGPSSTP